jgi:hypothetical protein
VSIFASEKERRLGWHGGREPQDKIGLQLGPRRNLKEPFSKQKNVSQAACGVEVDAVQKQAPMRVVF